MNNDRPPIDFIMGEDVKEDCYKARPVRLYLAGPMSGYVNYNFPLFHQVANLLRSQGFEVNNPADKETLDGTDKPDLAKVPTRAEAMRQDIPLVIECDGIVLLPNWKNSVGARFETMLATQCGMDVYEWDEVAVKMEKLDTLVLEGSTNMTTREELLSAIHSTEGSEEVRVRDTGVREQDSDRGGVELCGHYGMPSVPFKGGVILRQSELSDRSPGMCEDGAVSKSCEPLRAQQDGGERRPVASSSQGVKYDSGKLRFDLLAVKPLEQIVEIYTHGAVKYEDNNWRKGLSWGRVFAATMRHLWAWWRGQDRDEDSGLSPLAHAAWGCLTLMEYERTHPEMDDRVKS